MEQSDLWDEIIFNDPPGYEFFDWIAEYECDLSCARMDCMMEMAKDRCSAEEMEAFFARKAEQVDDYLSY